MIVFLGILLLIWPVIVFPLLGGLAVHKKWWSYDTLSLIWGGIGILLGVYYSYLFSGGFSNIQDTWPIWLLGVLLFGWLSWYMMRNFFILTQQRQLEKEQKEQKNK